MVGAAGAVQLVDWSRAWNPLASPPEKNKEDKESEAERFSKINNTTFI